MATNQPTRIATVNATGRHYIVVSVDFRTNRVNVWGELRSYSGRVGSSAFRTKHDGTKTFDLSAVTISNVTPSEQLMRKLFEQSKQDLRDRGFIVRGNRYTSPDAERLATELREAFGAAWNS